MLFPFRLIPPRYEILPFCFSSAYYYHPYNTDVASYVYRKRDRENYRCCHQYDDCCAPGDGSSLALASLNHSHQNCTASFLIGHGDAFFRDVFGPDACRSRLAQRIALYY